ncbi:hypothetical protein MERGE_002751 [Pneumocystis wakefieldiae]|uniref:UDP-galactose transporter homolog 1 n=1 Tax=Pneumocystis wakefieldiae TaxID=38082 RepID=A0A899FN79_9ASCO|nr:hypothetical protein MERGE_002751 [Pneumocystis wakefieldiae]
MKNQLFQQEAQESSNSLNFKDKTHFLKQPISSKKIRNTKNLSLKNVDQANQCVKEISTIISPLSKSYSTEQNYENKGFTSTNNHTLLNIIFANRIYPQNTQILFENDCNYKKGSKTYENKPVCIIEPNLWLFAEPETHIAKKFNVVINVAKEVKNPFLSQTSLDGNYPKETENISSERRIFQKNPLPIESSILPPVIINNIEYLHVLWDHNASTLSIDLPPLIDYITKKSIQENKKVLIHCQCGISRSASLIIAYVMKYLGLNIDSAYSYVKDKSPWIGPNMSLIYQLYDFNNFLYGKKKSSSSKKQTSPNIEMSSSNNSHKAIINKKIYISFLLWSILQERITTRSYGKEIFNSVIILSIMQSFIAIIVSFIFTYFITKRSRKKLPSLSKSLFLKLVLVALSSSLASPLGYTSLKHINYPTLILGKSCKLLPVMAIHTIFYKTHFTYHKYLIVAIVTSGITIFTLYDSRLSSKTNKKLSNDTWGLFLLSINLLLDGYTNSTQDQIFKAFPHVTGPWMMLYMNIISTVGTTLYLLCFTNELVTTHEFIKKYPSIIFDILIYGCSGAIGQLFIFHTLEKYGSLILITITLTRKMLTLLLSLIWFNHKLTIGQWIGVALVFYGASLEAYIKHTQLSKKKK